MTPGEEAIRHIIRRQLKLHGPVLMERSGLFPSRSRSVLLRYEQPHSTVCYGTGARKTGTVSQGLAGIPHNSSGVSRGSSRTMRCWTTSDGESEDESLHPPVSMASFAPSIKNATENIRKPKKIKPKMKRSAVSSEPRDGKLMMSRTSSGEDAARNTFSRVSSGSAGAISRVSSGAMLPVFGVHHPPHIEPISTTRSLPEPESRSPKPRWMPPKQTHATKAWESCQVQLIVSL